MQIWNTGRDLIGQGLSILGRAALDNVGDVYRLARHLDSLQDAVEKIPGLTDEGFPLRIFVGARPLAHENQAGGGISIAGNRLGAMGTQTAAVGRPDSLSDLIQRLQPEELVAQEVAGGFYRQTGTRYRRRALPPAWLAGRTGRHDLGSL
jgi:hypothetical protein